MGASAKWGTSTPDTATGPGKLTPPDGQTRLSDVPPAGGGGGPGGPALARPNRVKTQRFVTTPEFFRLTYPPETNLVVSGKSGCTLA
jgi:hypothetical protein